ncbi:uncharacterized protein LOC143341346 [Colletes latitarsis]|uniref:uncharacterized protein LOC143341346 n=1 Tax=Colletes latitarsis TaxID=2605962 RepID=UPI0040350E8C
MTANDASPTLRRLFVTDFESKTRFLIDTGVDLCVFPRSMSRGARQKLSYVLFVANRNEISTYGAVTLTLDLGLRRAFTWRFVVAEVLKLIIGVDFLHHYGLLVDIRNHKLIDNVTSLSVPGQPAGKSASTIPRVKTITGNSVYVKLLQKFPEITKPMGIPAAAKHSTIHYIWTTVGQPVTCKQRRLA